VIVLTGAGISTSLGIPDFRSKGTGLYSTLEHLGLNDPQEVFDIHTFKEDPTIFYSVAKDIIPSTDRYTPTHKFIAMLHERGKLLTNYSQNIDNLEIAAGVPKDRLIQCHGSFGSATCVECGYKTAGEAIFPDTNAGIIPKCPRCTQRLRPAPPKRKRSSEGPRGRRRRRRNGHDDDDDDDDDDDPAYDIPQAGVMKPDITFFGEDLPDEFSKRLTDDREKVDLVVVIGTSLKVTPVSEIVGWLPSHIPQLYISRQALSHINFDIDLLGDCDIVIEELCRRLGWELKHEMVEPGRITIKTEEGYKSRHVFKKEKLIKLPKSVLEDQLAEKASIITAQEQALMKQDSFILNLQTRMFHMQKKIKVLVDCRRAAEDHHGNPNMQEQLRVQISALKQQLKDKTQLENDLEAIQTSQLGISFHEVILKFNSIQGFIEDACASVGPIDIPDPASKLGHDKIWSGTVELWAEMGSGLTIPNLIKHCLDMQISSRRLTRLLAASALCHLVFEPVFPTLLTIDSPLLDQYRRQILNKCTSKKLLFENHT
jgi:NAD-dependent SIR2 family protein deacetylase